MGNDAWPPEWSELEQTEGLLFQQTGDGVELSGAWRGCEVAIAASSTRSPRESIETSVSLRAPARVAEVLRKLSGRSEGGSSAPGWRGEELETLQREGIFAFQPLVLIADLGGPTIYPDLDEGALADGVLRVVHVGAMHEPRHLRSILRGLWELTERLRVEDAVLLRLLTALFRRSGDPQTRLQCLVAMLMSFPSEAVTRAVARRAAASGDHRLTLVAACWLGGPAARQLMALAIDEVVSRTLRISALHGLGRMKAGGRLADDVDLSSTVLAVLVGLSKQDHLSGPMMRVAEAAMSLLVVGDAPKSVRIAREFVQSPNVRVALAAIDVLRQMGSVDDVELLQSLRTSSSGPIRSTAREAVERIQDRAIGAERGALQLTAEDQGHLSLQDKTAGGLAVEPDSDDAGD